MPAATTTAFFVRQRWQVAFVVAWLTIAAPAAAQISRPKDAPTPLSPEASRQRFRVPPGYRVELIASEPLVREPSGICWDERGRMFVSELHGYNLEGQYDIEELNKTGKLDRVVRRVQAAERHKKAAEQETYGTIKLLKDTDGDGRMDEAVLWADRLPPCLGICPARGGLIAACHTKILFVADRDGDDRAEVREVLFEGFAQAPLERSVNSPQWGPDNWIYLGSSAGGGTVRGKHLERPLAFPNTDIRIHADGSAIEPVTGRTHTMGFAFTDAGDRFVISTGTPGIFVAPLAWRYLARNPNAAAPRLEESASNDSRVWPTSRPHPWRTRRAEDPGFAKFYTDRYGVKESTPNGYFTSACSPLVYRDSVLPGLRGHLLACEPAQNLVHRSRVARDGLRLRLQRLESEQQSEFLTSSDPWFHAISLAHAPDGTIYIVDFYREIIEDYSAIPRYLQQQYGLIAGANHGRIWRLTHDRVTAQVPQADMSELSPEQLTDEIGSSRHWRRQTARRLLLELHEDERLTSSQREGVGERLRSLVLTSSESAVVLNAMATLEGVHAMTRELTLTTLRHAEPSVRRNALRLAERYLAGDHADERVRSEVLKLASDDAAIVRLQAALSLGEATGEPRVFRTLAALARQDGDEPWMRAAILTATPDSGGKLLAELLREPRNLENAASLIEPLVVAIANRRDRDELSEAVQKIAAANHPGLQTACLRGLRTSLREPLEAPLSTPARDAIKALARSGERTVREEALPLISLLRVETAAERAARMSAAFRDLADIQLPTETRIEALRNLADQVDSQTTDALLAALPSSTPRLRDAILSQLLRHRSRLPKLLDAIQSGRIAPTMLNAVQRASLLESSDSELRGRAAKLLLTSPNMEGVRQLPRYTAALSKSRDVAEGERLFRKSCGNCHQAHGIGHAVGPNLNAEFLRAEETIVRDVLTPSEKISAGFAAYSIVTTSGRVLSGVLGDESPTSITLRQAEGKEATVLRKDVEQMRAMSISLMPEDLHQSVSPQDLANILAWLRRPPNRLVLLDENEDLLIALNEGSGVANFIRGEAFTGERCLQVTPPQRYSSRIPNWSFRIRERPGPGEYRYLRFAWKSTAAHGVMIELADNGHWPPAAKPLRRYHAGRNSTGWASVEASKTPPENWTVVTRDLWKDFGDFTLTGFAPTAMGGPALFDRLELLREKEGRVRNDR